MKVFLVIIALLIVCVLIIFWVLKRVSSDINNRAKQHFMSLGQDYFRDISSKKDNDNIKIVKDEKKKIVNDSLICVDNNNHYEIKNIFEIVNRVDQKFNLNYEKIVKIFINHKESENDLIKYNKLCDIKKMIDDTGMYDILTSDETDGVEQLASKIEEIDKDLFDEYYLNKKRFDVQDFIGYLENEIKRYDPHIYVLVGDKKINYDYLGEKVKTIYSNQIFKGIKVLYKNKMYDYSLS